MARILLLLTLALTSSVAAAGSWPWQEEPEEQLEYCAGFVVGGLTSNQSAGPQRTDLWLAWNYLIRAGALGEIAGAPDFQTGRDRFSGETDAAMVASMLEETDGRCGLGRSGLEITGW
jgi:hypothetical protein